MSPSLSGLSLAAIAEAVDSDAPVPGGGAVAAFTGALASALAGMAARFSARGAAQPGQFSALADQAAALRIRCLQLADDDAKAYAAYVAATRMLPGPDPQPRRQALRTATDEAAAVPLELSATAAEIARLARELTLSGSERMRSDSATAALLAAAVASSAAIFVAENLRVNPADPRVGQARAAAGAATAAARQCTAAFADLTPERRSR